ncbi:MAG: hypothetical protein HC887_09320 [Desulfobacteraceae bacterium]|nr:hypothetical protein [Desulfobacteraceae bacterium]
MKTDYIALSSRITEVLADAERVVSRAEFLLDKAKNNNDDSYMDGIALNLHSFYTGVERIFEDIARTVDQSVPSGQNWHRDLLLQMSASSGMRQPVISRETRYCLDEYRGFRHLVRNIYTFNLKPSRLSELTLQLRQCYHRVADDLQEFVKFLEQLADRSNSKETTL